MFCSSEVEKTSTFWRDVALIAGATIAGIAAVGIIAGLAVAAKKGKLPGMKSSGPKKRRLSVSSVTSSSSSSDESDKESSNKRKRPKTALRSKTKVRLPPVKSAKIETLPKVSIKGQSKLPPIAKKWSAQFTWSMNVSMFVEVFFMRIFFVFNVCLMWKIIENYWRMNH